MKSIIGALVVLTLSTVMLWALKLAFMPDLQITWMNVLGMFVAMTVWFAVTLSVCKGACELVLLKKERELARITKEAKEIIDRNTKAQGAKRL